MSRNTSVVIVLMSFVSLGYSVETMSQNASSIQSPKNSKAQHATPILNYQWERSRAALPIHPAKPCNACSRPEIHLVFPRLGKIPGWRGRPSIPGEPGGCECNSCRLRQNSPNISQFWPRPFTGIFDGDRTSTCHSRPRDVFDCFEDFKLVHYKRTDNGFTGNDGCGRNADPFGCLGESKFWSEAPQTFALSHFSVATRNAAMERKQANRASNFHTQNSNRNLADVGERSARRQLGTRFGYPTLKSTRMESRLAEPNQNRFGQRGTAYPLF